MPAVQLHVGMRLWIDDIAHEISGLTAEGHYVVKNLSSSLTQVMSRTDIFNGVVNKSVALPLPERIQKTRFVSSLKRDLRGLSPEEYAEFVRRWRYVQPLYRAGVTALRRKVMVAAIGKQAVEMQDPTPPSYSSVRRWYRRFRDADYDVRVLMPGKRRRGYRTRRVSPESVKVADRVIKQYYLTRARMSVRKLHYQLRVEIKKENAKPGVFPIAVPSLRWLHREVGKWSRYDLMAAREGKRAADHQFRDWRQGIRPTRPYERIEIDHTKLDLFAVDENPRLPIGRPWLTIAVDVYSRMPAGFHIGFDPPGWHTVAACLEHLILPKNGRLAAYPGVLNSWPCDGVPETIVCDNGMEFHSEQFVQSCQQLDIQIQYSPVRSPWMKGTVESYFRTVNKQLLNGLPGYTFQNVGARGDYDPKQNAVIGMSALVEIVYKWLVDDFSQSFKEGTHSVPIDRWNEGVAKFEPALPGSADDVRFALSNTAHRTIQRYGIKYMGLYYQSRELKDIAATTKGCPSVWFRINRNDLGEIVVIDPRDDSRIVVPAVNQAYARGKTLWQHLVIRRFQRRTGDTEIKRMQLAEVQDYILRIVMGEWEKSYEKRGRQIIARFLGIDSDTPQGKVKRDQVPPAEGDDGQAEKDKLNRMMIEKIVDSEDLKDIEQPQSDDADDDEEDDGAGYYAEDSQGRRRAGGDSEDDDQPDDIEDDDYDD